MVKIVIIGWYGTETIGDRAILAGLFRVFEQSFMDFEIKLGSIFPILSERTLLEDLSFYKRCSKNRNLKIEIFNSLSSKELQINIKGADLLAVGGGPLMDLTFMYMLEYAFKVANKYKVKTALIGCGWGPLRRQEYIKSTLRLIRKSDLTIFRDEISLENYLKFFGNLKNPVNITSSVDPAFFSAEFFYKETQIARKKDFIAINIRDVKLDQYQVNEAQLEERLGKLIQTILERSTLDIFLVPMHTFIIGGDDRIILNRLLKQIKNSRVKVLHDPLNLEQVMKCYYDASFCVGMRFHSIVLQTMLNGKNFILDYTDPNNGKIIGMLRELEIEDFYKNRYVSLASDFEFENWIFECERFVPDFYFFNSHMNNYIGLLKSLF